MKHKWKRRDFLRTAGIAGLLAPVAAYWPDLPEARAITDKRNMVLVFLPNGKMRGNPFVRHSGGSWEFDDGFRPYNAFRDRAIAIEEYSFEDFCQREYSGDQLGHCCLAACMFTGDVAYAPGGRASGAVSPSIDQIVAWDYLDRGVVANPLRKSLNIHVTGSSFRLESFCQTPADYSLNRTYAKSHESPPVSMVRSPRDGFAQMFGELATESGSTIEELWLQGRSILDVPAAELDVLRPTLPAEGQRLVDQHLHSLRELERGLAAEDAEAPITIPDRPPAVELTPANHQQVCRQWVDIIDAALRLDRTRIVTLQFGGCASRFHVPDLGLGSVGSGTGSGSDHHSYSHHGQSQVPLFMNWYAERISSLLTEMTGRGAEAKPDILQDSVVMVGMEFGWNHKAYDVPVTLFGECGGYFDTGKVVTYGNDVSTYHKHTGTLLSVCHAMGADRLEVVGRNEPEYQRGPVPELRA